MSQKDITENIKKPRKPRTKKVDMALRPPKSPRRLCVVCDKTLVKMGVARKNGKSHGDWENRTMHKKCWMQWIQSPLALIEEKEDRSKKTGHDELLDAQQDLHDKIVHLVATASQDSLDTASLDTDALDSMVW